MPPRQTKPSSFEGLILEQLSNITLKVEESLTLSRDNNREIKSLRTELGLEGEHGRFPSLEVELKRLNTRADKQEMRIDAMEVSAIESRAQHRLIATVLGILSGGLGAAVFSAVIHYFGAK